MNAKGAGRKGLQGLAQNLVDALERGLRKEPTDACLVKFLDGKPLVVSPYSQDKHATRGFVGKATRCKGFKLFALADRHGILAWEVGGLGTSELAVAPWLLARLDGAGYVLADALHDTNTLHGIAGVCNHQLIAPPVSGRARTWATGSTRPSGCAASTCWSPPPMPLAWSSTSNAPRSSGTLATAATSPGPGPAE
jgi:hypothetical protein